MFFCRSEDSFDQSLSIPSMLSEAQGIPRIIMSTLFVVMSCLLESRQIM